jgi:excinuclease UvrABC nuclease subunit
MDSKDAKRRAEAIARVEGRIHEKENDVQRLYRELQKASEKQEFNRAHRLSEQLAQVQAALDSLMADWEKLAV